MNRHEAIRKTTDIILGKRVEGTVAAVLRNPDPSTHRYIVTTSEGFIDTRVRSYFRLVQLFPIYYPRPSLRPGDVFDARTLSAHPWEDGQTI